MPNNASGHYHLLGLRIDELDPERILDSIVKLSKDKSPGYTCVTNAQTALLVSEDPDFQEQVNDARYNIVDSRILQIVLSIGKRAKSYPTILGSTLMMDICKRLSAEDVSIGLVGGRSDAMLNALKEELSRQIPELNISYSYSPPFRPMTDAEVAMVCDDINQTDAGLVFVGLGCPKQERWMAANSKRINAHLIGVGAAFDWNSGAVPHSPRWVHMIGFEWLYRLFCEPRRLWRRYLIGGPKFLYKVTKELWASAA